MHHYELTNHLGNVMAVVSDKRVHLDDNGDTLIDRYSPSLAAVYDYFPFGMLMPGRYISDTAAHCVTLNTTVMVEKPIEILVSPAGIKTTTFLVGQPVPPSVGSLPVAVDFASEVLYLYHYVPAAQHPGGWAARSSAAAGGGLIYELELSGEPSGITSFMHLHMDTSVQTQQFSFGMDLGRNASGNPSAQVRVRQYYSDSTEQYRELVQWRSVSNNGASLLVPVDKQLIMAGGKTVVEWKFNSFDGKSFASGTTVKIIRPWTVRTQWVAENVVVRICDEKDNYRFGFNGQEKVNEIAGIGNHLDFKFRGYDSRIGRFTSVDPLAREYPWNSTYAFAENDVIRSIDLEGLEKVDVVTTAFAPFDLFGSDGFGSFNGDGNSRKFGRELNKYRTSGSIKIDVATGKYIDKWAGVSRSVYHRNSNAIFDDYVHESSSETKLNGFSGSKGFVGAIFSVAGKNKAAIISADIDIKVTINFQRITDTKYKIVGAVKGDRFPSNETYLRDENNNILLLGVSGPNSGNKDTGPYTELPFKNSRKMSSFQFNVIFDDGGKTIKGVETNDGKYFDRDSWNSQYEKLDPQSPKTGTITR